MYVMISEKEGRKMGIDRIDIHAPSKIIPADYEYVAQEHAKSEGFGDAGFMMHERKVFLLHKEKTGGDWSTHAHGGNCMVCGSVNAIYTVIYYHAPTNTYIRTGQDCAEKFDTEHADAFKVFREAAKAAIHAKAGKAKAQGLLAAKGLSDAWAVYLEPRKGLPENKPTPYEEATITNMIGKLVQYGSLSDKQYAFISVLLQKIINRAAEQIKRDAEKALAKDCPEGRIIIQGKVLSTKLQVCEYTGSSIWKMLVQHGDGWKVWGTIPSSLTVERGDKIEFTATVTPSNDDKKFGFYKRPMKATITEEVGGGVVTSEVVQG